MKRILVDRLRGDNRGFSTILATPAAGWGVRHHVDFTLGAK
jgi:hypothetical protein